MTNSSSFRLFKSRTGFIDGMAALLDFSRNIDRYNTDKTEKMADFNSLYADWIALGQDMERAIEEYARESN